MIGLLCRHRVFAVYLVSLLYLALSAFIYAQLADRSTDHVLHVLGVAAGTIVVYGSALKLLERVRPSWTADLPVEPAGTMTPGIRTLLTLMVGLYGMIAFGHFLMLGNIPVLEALTADTDLGVSIARQQGYFGLPGFMRYASDYSVKALGPALLLSTYYFRSRLFWAVLAIGVIYSLGLFARILPIILFLPLLIYMLMLRRWLHLAGAMTMLAVVLGSVTILSSITLRESTMRLAEEPVNTLTSVEKMPKPQDLRGHDGDWRRTSAVYALYERAMVVPGQVIYQWFDYYDEPERRENGCGYRLLATKLGCSYVPVPSKLYAAFYPENYENGMRGSLNAASFMAEFANFGARGFLLSALLAGCLFAAIRVIYRNHPLALPMNLPLIVAAMESSIVTALNSGAGWLVMTAIFFLLFRARKE